MRSLMWFRADLRVQDNTALWEACSEASPGRAGGVVAVFTVCPDQWREHDEAPTKVDFWLRNLRALERVLGSLGVPLKLVLAPRFQDVPEALLDLARRHACDALFFNRQYELNEARRDARVERVFARAGLPTHAFHDAVVLEPGTVKTQSETWYSKFTPFKNRWLERYHQHGMEVRPAPEPVSRIDVRSDPLPELVPGFAGRTHAKAWPAGEAEGHRRLRDFVVTGLSEYDARRDTPSVEGTSSLSPYLAAGVLSPRQCVRAAEEAQARAKGRDVWVSELVWREFYKHLLVGYPRLSKSQDFRDDYAALAWREDREHYEAWCAGQTGYPLVDAGMRQLLELGWMHNRVRMVVAMFLTKHLLIDWRWGEQHFMRHLIDGDLAANNGGWQWSASTGTDAQPYFRVFNPWTQSSRFDPEGRYIRAFVPELADVPARALHDPAKLAAASSRLGVGYPAPIVEHKAARARAIETFKAVKQTGS